jgi:rod shape-determining protein MreD
MTRRILYWILILALQLLVLNHLELSAFIVPQVFIILLITLPLHLSRLNQVLIAAGLGLLVDFFTATPGIHTSACLWLIVFRIGLLNRQDLKQQIANRLPYTVSSAGLVSFAYTAAILVFFYHLYLFFIGSIGALHGATYGLTVVSSSLLSLTIIAIIQFSNTKHI